MAEEQDRLNFTWLIPGKLAGSKGPASQEDLQYLAQQGVKVLVRLTDLDEALIESEQVEAAGIRDLHEPVADFCPPSQAQLDTLIRFIDEEISKGNPVDVSCRAGLGRTGTVLACYLIYKGQKVKEALDTVRRIRPGSVKTYVQGEAVWRYAKRIGRESG